MNYNKNYMKIFRIPLLLISAALTVLSCSRDFPSYEDLHPTQKPDTEENETTAPNPSKASSTSGWKEYGSKDAGGTGLSVSGRLQSSYQLTDSEYESGYKDRMKIFENASVGTDWLKE